MTTAPPTIALPREDPWELAKARFLNTLDSEEKVLFNNATLENIYYSTNDIDRDDAERSKARSLAIKIQPLVSAIESYGKAVDTLAQIAPLYLSPIWGCIRVLLVIARSHGKFYERMVETLGRIGDVIPRFRDYERIYCQQKHQRLTQALSYAYLDIIVLCTQFRKTICAQRNSSARRLFRPISLEHQFEEAVERFRQHKQNVDEEARTCNLIEAAEQRDAQLVLLASERRRHLLAKLSKVDCLKKHRRLGEARHSGTGVWFTACREYNEWELPERGPSVLCCYGIPGCGKSVLASSIIDSLSNGRTVIFYYCDYSDKRTLEPTNLFGTLARQALEQLGSIPESLAYEIEQVHHNGERITDCSAALELFQQSIDTLARPIYVILDGLDEASEASKALICHGLKRLFDKGSCTTKLLITGREELGSSLQLKPHIPLLRIPILSHTIALDVENYVRASTRQKIVDGLLVIQDPTLEDTVVRELVAGANGMFLWVEFQLNELCDSESDHRIRLVLQNLPRNLSETYDRLLSKISEVERRAMVERMFKWIVCARQPLHIDQLREGVSFTLYDQEWDQAKIVTKLGRLVRACGNLVIIDGTGIVQLAHYTVQQYLLSEGESGIHFTLQEANAMAGEFCIAYLRFSNFDTRITKYANNMNTDMITLGNIATRGELVAVDQPGRWAFQLWNTLRNSDFVSRPEVDMVRHLPKRKVNITDLPQFSSLSYVVKHWLWHTLDFTSEGTIEMSRAVQGARRAQLFCDLIFCKHILPDVRPWGDFHGAVSRRSYTGLLGWGLMANHRYLIKMAFAEKDSVQPHHLLHEAWQWFIEPDSLHLRSSINMAQSRLDIVKAFPEDSQILQSPAPGWLYSRLLCACRRGHLEALQACNLKRVQGWTGLAEHLIIIAAMAGRLSVIKHLCNNLYNPRALRTLLDGQYLNALEHAIVAGHTQIVAYLLDHGYQATNLLGSEESFFTTLDGAIEHDDIGAIQALLLVGTNVSANDLSPPIAPDHPGMLSSFVRAVRRGQLHVVETMLQYSINPDLPDHEGCLPIFEAIKASRVSVVEILLKYNCNLGKTASGTPLDLAISLGDIHIATILSNPGAQNLPAPSLDEYDIDFNDTRTFAVIRWNDILGTITGKLFSTGLDAVTKCREWQELADEIRLKLIDQSLTQAVKRQLDRIQSLPRVLASLMTIFTKLASPLEVKSDILWSLLSISLELSYASPEKLRQTLDTLVRIRRITELFNRGLEALDQPNEAPVAMVDFLDSTMTILTDSVRHLQKCKSEIEAEQAWPVLSQNIKNQLATLELTVRHVHDMMTHSTANRNRIIENMSLKNALIQEEEEPRVFPIRVLPFRRNPKFYGRTVEMERIAKYLNPSDGQSLAYTIYGRRGVGKTELALEFAYSEMVHFDAIFWVQCDSSAAIRDSFTNIALLLCLPGADFDGHHEENLLSVHIWLRKTKRRWLLIFDSAADAQILQQYWPLGASGSILITSRKYHNFSQYTSRNGDTIKPFDATQSWDVLLQLLDNNWGGLYPNKMIPHLETIAGKNMLEKLEGLGLAIQQAANLIRDPDIGGPTIAMTFDCFQKRIRDLPERYSSMRSSAERALDALWDMVFTTLSEDALSLLRVLAWLSPDKIPIDLFLPQNQTVLESGLEFCKQDKSNHTASSRAALASVATPSPEFEQAITQLLNRELIKQDSRVLSIHRVVQEAINFQGVDDVQKSFDLASRLINEQFPTLRLNQSSFGKWTICQEYIPHGVFLARKYEEYLRSGILKSSTEFIQLSINCARFLHEIGDFVVSARVFGVAHAAITDRTSLMYAELGAIAGSHFYELNRLDECRGTWAETLQIRKKLLAHNDPRMADIYHNYGDLELAADNPEIAMQYFDRATKIWISEGDSTTPQLALTYLHTGKAHMLRGDLSEALRFTTFAESLLVRTIGAEKEALTNVHYAYGNIYFEQKNYTLASRSYDSCLKIALANMSMHPIISAAYYSQGCVEFETNNMERARWHLEKAIKAAELRSPTHDGGAIARIVWKLSLVLETDAWGQYAEEAKALRERAEMAKRNLLAVGGGEFPYLNDDGKDHEEEDSYDALVPLFLR